MNENGVSCLLMGGQACVLYGAAEFSRDVDLAVLCGPENLDKLRGALDDLQASCVAVPPFELKYLERGHAIHFRCQHPDAKGLRVDVMSNMRGVDGFQSLWDRRTTVAADDGAELDLLALPDLVAAKKTQRDKDWPMIRRLVEANYFENRNTASVEHVEFWLLQCRTPELLISIARGAQEKAQKLAQKRPLLEHALNGDFKALETALLAEEHAERIADRKYWQPLKAELELLRHNRIDQE